MVLPLSSQSHMKGGGTSIQMDSPIVRAIKNLGIYTKVSYLWLVLSIIMFVYGVKHIVLDGSSTSITCRQSYCTIRIKRSGTRKQLSTQIHRKQLMRSNLILINANHDIVQYITTEKEPDPNMLPTSDPGSTVGTSHSYTLVFQPYDASMEEFVPRSDVKDVPGRKNHNKKKNAGAILEKQPDPEILHSNIQEKLNLELNIFGEPHIIMKEFKPRKSAHNNKRNSARSQHSRLKSYIDSRRSYMELRENTGPGWKAVGAMMSGIMSILFAALLGQFWEDDKRAFVSRRGRPQMRSNPNVSSSASRTGTTHQREIKDYNSGYAVGTKRVRGSNILNKRR